MPRIGWLAVGVAAAALAIGSLDVGGGPAMVFGGTALVMAGVVSGSRPARVRPGGFVLLGAGILLLRVGVAGGPAPTGTPDPGGPWIGIVEGLDPPRDGRQRAVLRLDPASTRVLADVPPEPRLAPGDIVEVEGRLRPPPEGPYGDYLRRSGLVATLTAQRHERLRRVGGPAAALDDVRTAAVEGLARALPEPEAGLAAGILVGRRERIDRAVAADFATAGLSHIVAISGWNIAIVGAAVGTLARRASRRRRAWLTIAAVGGYVAFVGPSASVVRAAVMALVVLLARIAGRGAQAAGALAVTVVALLLVDPAFARDAGFQLSVAATAGLLRWATPLSERLHLLAGGRLPGWLTETLAVSLAAQFATLPLVVAAFGRISLVAPAANLVVVPLVPMAMGLGGIALLGGVVGGLGAPAVATAAGLPGWVVLRVVVETAHAAATLPFASLAVAEPLGLGIGLAAGVGVLAVAASRPGAVPRGTLRSGRDALAEVGSPRRDHGTGTDRRRRRRLGLLAVVPLVAAVLAGAYRPGGEPHLVVFDVGQGDAILVEGGSGGRLLVDGGPDPARLLRLLDARIPPWDRRIDVVVVTHPHEDHVAGLPTLLGRYRVGAILTNGMTGPGPAATTLAGLLASDRRAATLGAGDRLEVDAVALDVLWPLPGTVPSSAPDTGRQINDASIVLLGTVGRHRFLLMGDAEDDVDPLLLARGLPRVDVLKVAHHGSRTATSAAFLQTVRPAVAVVSVGADNPYGHPAPETLARLRDVGARVLRTDEVGAVEVVLRPRAVEVASAAGIEEFGADRAAEAAAAGRASPPAARAGATPRAGAGGADGSGNQRAAAVGYDPDDAAPRLGRPDDPLRRLPVVPDGDGGAGRAARSSTRRRGRPVGTGARRTLARRGIRRLGAVERRRIRGDPATFASRAPPAPRRVVAGR